LVGQRRSFLSYLKSRDLEQFNAITQRLQIRSR
jgi:ribosomal protein S15P/S13E